MEYESKPQFWQGLTASPSSPAKWVVGQPWTAMGQTGEQPEARARRKAKAAADREPPAPESGLVNVVELTPAEIENAWDATLYAPPKDEDVFVRCQKIVIAHCTYYAPTISKGTYTLEHAYQQARKVARPLAALGAGIPLTHAEMTEFAFEIFDALASWADAQDAAAHAIATVFRAYAVPRGNYRQVKASRRG
jgi:hypothetical protein